MKKIIILLLMFFSFFCIAGCSEPPVDPDKIVSISINPDTLPEKVEVTKIKNFIDNLALVITYADGSNDYIAFQRSMISEDDLLKLYSVGVHKVTVNYLDLQTEFTVETYEKMAEYYKLTVVYPDDTKVLEEINVRWIQSVDFYKSATTIEGESLMLLLDMAGIAVSTGSACSSGDLSLSHVLKAIGLPPEIAQGTIRFSFGTNNTKEEIDYVVEVLKKNVAKLREMSPLRAKPNKKN
jgi:hypothetical protein